ncbi:MAG: TPM domain-containing protein [Sporocytophaga sp.]|uniref:TPM domain-containing protein n=1 Tax=Sporocytophaga sp. TaxID=2231183 RepID=UPI001B19C1D7|nr:TPM domain-containing protein [Sporocytophaga sp.]MBO9699344.1 TPM domain-containing protein [Sporocytophaga sp.]
MSNPDGLLSSDDVNSINQLITDIENKTTAQIAVVVVQSIGDQVPKEFANRLFNYWGIGQKDKNNGLLLLIVMDPKRWEFETGYGLEGTLPDVILFRVGQQEMVPHFKEGDFGGGILAGLTKVSEILLKPEAKQNDLKNDAATDLSNFFYTFFGIISFIITIRSFLARYRSKKKFKKEGNKVDIPMNSILYYFLLLSVPALLIINYSFSDFLFKSQNPLKFILILYLQSLLLALASRINRNIRLKKSDPCREYNALREDHSSISRHILLFPFAFIPYYIWYLFHRRALRLSPVLSATGMVMKRLREKADNAYLDEGQRLEEKFGSVDYDVWITEDKSQHIIKSYTNPSSKYTICRSCNYHTLYTKNDIITAKSPKYGLAWGIETVVCKNCNDAYEEEYTKPIRKRGTFFGFSSGGSGGGSGGGFGGGSSGGGGAGGSW